MIAAVETTRRDRGKLLKVRSGSLFARREDVTSLRKRQGEEGGGHRALAETSAL